MTLQTRDLSGDVVAQYQLFPNFFEMYRCDKNMVFSCNMQSLTNIMHAAKPGYAATITAEEDENYVNIIFGNEDGIESVWYLRGGWVG